MNVEIILSCMHEKDMSIVERSNIKGDVLIVNQCDENKVIEKKSADSKARVRMIFTTERGLSKSRNMCIDNARGDILQISDDDEWFEDDYQEKICSAYNQYPQADVILFKIANFKKSYPKQAYRMGCLTFLKGSSGMISFRRESIQNAGIRFDEMMGSGTGNGGQEETMFLRDCLKKKLWIHYVPIQIASLNPESSSQWFTGYNKQYFLNRGWAIRRILGWPMAIAYCLEYAWAKRKLFEFSVPTTFWYMLKGICSPKEKPVLTP